VHVSVPEEPPPEELALPVLDEPVLALPDELLSEEPLLDPLDGPPEPPPLRLLAEPPEHAVTNESATTIAPVRMRHLILPFSPVQACWLPPLSFATTVPRRVDGGPPRSDVARAIVTGNGR
jgi:hypothetical protein